MGNSIFDIPMDQLLKDLGKAAKEAFGWEEIEVGELTPEELAEVKEIHNQLAEKQERITGKMTAKKEELAAKFKKEYNEFFAEVEAEEKESYDKLAQYGIDRETEILNLRGLDYGVTRIKKTGKLVQTQPDPEENE